MIERLKAWGRGALAAFAAMAVFAVAIGCFIALMLLVISMEEGGDNLTTYAMSLTGAVILLSQGVGFAVAPVTFTLIPLLLTLLLIGMVRAFAQRFAPSAGGYCAGLILWLTFSALIRQSTSVGLLDELWLVLIKTGAVFTVGYLLAAIPVSPLTTQLVQWMRDAVSPLVRRTIRLGFRLGVAMMFLYLFAGLVTVIVWCVMDHAAMGKLFELLDMGMGSRIVTTIACLAWLPNLCIWAMSWLFGGGFSIGGLGTFSLWLGQASSLPAIPVFGLLPDPVDNATVRMMLMLIPLVVGLVSASVTIWSKRGFGLRAGGPDRKPGAKRLIEDFAYPAGAFCLSGALVSVSASLIFLVSNGGLGTGRLAGIGVDVVQSTRMIGRPTAFGLLAAWLLALVGVAAVFGIRWVAGRIRLRGSDASNTVDDAGGRPPTPQRGPDRPRTVSNVPERERPMEETKEEQDDKH